MTPATGGEFLFSGQREFYRAAEFTGYKGGAKLPGSHLHLAAKTAADKRFDDADIIFPHLQGRGQQALDKVGGLG